MELPQRLGVERVVESPVDDFVGELLDHLKGKK
jgi:hypothetical protein